MTTDYSVQLEAAWEMATIHQGLADLVQSLAIEMPDEVGGGEAEELFLFMLSAMTDDTFSMQIVQDDTATRLEETIREYERMEDAGQQQSDDFAGAIDEQF